jgi:sporulation protein YlmC with PRC-barrel domain
MDRQRKIIIGTVAGTFALCSAMTAVAMTPGMTGTGGGHLSAQQQHMSGLKVSGLAGYMLRDSDGRDVGRVVNVEADAKGRTRYVHAVLNGGEDVRIAAFRAQLDKKGQAIDLTVPVAAVVNDPGALIALAPDTTKMVVASAAPVKSH